MLFKAAILSTLLSVGSEAGNSIDNQNFLVLVPTRMIMRERRARFSLRAFNMAPPLKRLIDCGDRL